MRSYAVLEAAKSGPPHRSGYLAERKRAAEEVSADDFLNTIEDTLMYEKYYTPEQMEQLADRREEVGEERIRQVQQEWQDLLREDAK